MMRVELETVVLKGVSRSFYLSLRLLPDSMRRAAGIAYLLARTSDTIADSMAGSVEKRIDMLSDFVAQTGGERPPKPFTPDFFSGLQNPRERILLQSHLEILQALHELSEGELRLILEVLEIIISGQILDLQRFGNGESKLIALKTAHELEDYTWRVAGCVGVFWTRLGFLTMGNAFSSKTQAELEQWGREYGEGLQLVNILRDFQTDRNMGRCYLPVSDPLDDSSCLAEFQKWRELALKKVSCGKLYAENLKTWRLRLASGLPAAIALETLNRLQIRHLCELEPKVKITRKHLYGLIFRQCLGF